MDKATRRELPSSVDASGRPKRKPARLSDLAGGLVEGFEGVRRLEDSDWQAPASLEWQEEQVDWAINPTVDDRDHSSGRARLILLLTALGVFALALLPRLYFLYFVTDPDILIPSWSNDTWHRWQIAYLSKEIGFSNGFLRLWDFKGLEYYWGVLHPLMLAGLFAITKSVDVMILRWLTLVTGVLNIVFFYLLGKRFWNWQVGLAAALFAALNPIVILNDPREWLSHWDSSFSWLGFTSSRGAQSWLAASWRSLPDLELRPGF